MHAKVNKSSRPALFNVRFDNPFFERYRIAIHVTFWVSLLIYEGLIWGMVDGEYSRRLTFAAAEIPVKIGATYFTLYFLIDKFFVHRKYAAFLIGLVASMLVFGLLFRLLSYHILYPAFYPNGNLVPVLYFPKILIGIFAIYSIAGIVASFHIAKLWHRHQQVSQRLEKEKLESELKLLKSQINPHFLFNTLNNLYALTLNNAKAAPEVVHKLSELMSYLLYDSNQNEVSLEKELQYIDNYISLEKLRYESRLDVSLNIYNNVQGITIAPLIILPFVENCFKHGARNQLFNAWVRIDVSIQEHVLIVKIENSKNTDGNDENKKVSGIGLENVRKRLELIYPDRHELQLLDEVDSYLVILKLELAKGEALQYTLNQRNIYTLQNEMFGSR
jgi:two-component system, LytTR family, sensor kinase